MTPIRYTDKIEDVSPENLTGFFVDWPSHPDPEAHYQILKSSAKVWLALEADRCVGFCNALTDGVFYAFIPLLEVLPDYRGKGTGSELMTRMVASLQNMYAIDVACDESVASFYEKLGFAKCVGMVKRNYQNQNPHSKNGTTAR